MSAPSIAKQLVDIIAAAVEEIERDTAKRMAGGKTTDVNEPIVAPEEALEMTPSRRKAIRDLRAATQQLTATFIPAALNIQEVYCSYFLPVAIDIVRRGGIADLIHSVDPDSTRGGVHVDLLANKSGIIDPQKLNHVLRFLAIRNIFSELSPKHWANNRLSLPLRSDSPNTQLNFIAMQRESIALPAFFELSNVLFEPTTISSNHLKSTAFHKYYNTQDDFFDFINNQFPDGSRAEQFGKAMVEINVSSGGEAQYKGYQWEKLGPKGTLVDVGGGIGAAAQAISRLLPGWNIVIQDRDEVIKQAIENSSLSHSSPNLEFEKVDFFNDQPAHRVRTVDVYFLQQILHDWPYERCIKILENLRKAAKPSSRLLISEIRVEAGLNSGKKSVILSNQGIATTTAHIKNLCMMAVYNAEERSEEEFSVMFRASGWILQASTPLANVIDHFIFEAVVDPNWTLH